MNHAIAHGTSPELIHADTIAARAGEDLPKRAAVAGAEVLPFLGIPVRLYPAFGVPGFLPASSDPSRLWSFPHSRGIEMRFFMFLLIGIIGLASIETASARSCTEQGALCVSWAKANVPDVARQGAAMAICREEIPKCRARCKAGNKYFVGIGGSNQYPIDTCN